MLVMLYRSLPPEQLTAEIMEQTLHRLRYDVIESLPSRVQKRSAGLRTGNMERTTRKSIRRITGAAVRSIGRRKWHVSSFRRRCRWRQDIISIHDYAIFHRTENREFMRQLEASGHLVQLGQGAKIAGYHGK